MLWVRAAFLLCARSSSTLLALGTCAVLGWSGAQARILMPLVSAWSLWLTAGLIRVLRSTDPRDESVRACVISLVLCVLAGTGYSTAAGRLELAALCETWGWTFFLLRLAPSPLAGSALAVLLESPPVAAVGVFFGL